MSSIYSSVLFVLSILALVAFSAYWLFVARLKDENGKELAEQMREAE